MDSKTITKSKQQIQLGTKYDVILLNDHYTPFEFVIQLLQVVFGKTNEAATVITNAVHNNGSGVAGTYIKEVAIQKQIESMQIAKREGHPLRVEIKEK